MEGTAGTSTRQPVLTVVCDAGERARSEPRLAERLAVALRTSAEEVGRVATGEPVDRHDRMATLLLVYDLHTGPRERFGAAVRLAGHPAVAELKWRLEGEWLAELSALPVPPVEGATVGETMRALAARNRLPDVYRWLAKRATWSQVVDFLSLEGGPDAGFDDLVAACQVGLSGPAKLELATNYWDEMGNGDAEAVHTVLHQRLVDAVGIETVPLSVQPVSALERAALGGLLATNRWLQPEMLGALGLVELQAGPRCRLVLQAFDRCGAPADAYPFYAVHADVDPRHGKDWVEKALEPLCAADPATAAGLLRGATWRQHVDTAFCADAYRLLREGEPRAAS